MTYLIRQPFIACHINKKPASVFTLTGSLIFILIDQDLQDHSLYLLNH